MNEQIGEILKQQFDSYGLVVTISIQLSNQKPELGSLMFARRFLKTSKPQKNPHKEKDMLLKTKHETNPPTSENSSKTSEARCKIELGSQ